MTIPPAVLTLSEVLDTFNLEQVNAEFFVGTQIDEIDITSSAATSQRKL